MKFNLLLLTFFIYASSFGQNKATVSGVLTDKDANLATLPFANAVIKGTNASTTTDETGKYSLNIIPGNHILVFSFLGYENLEVPFTIAEGEKLTINKTLGSAGYKLEDVVIKSNGSREKETALLLEQKKAVEIKQSIGAQEMSRKGISDVEEGLTKITGISKVDGRGLFVRGLEDRYNNLLINGLAVPSNNPFKKIIPLDIFPTDIVGVIDTYKTFNTNIYGDFAGGTFDIITAKGGKSQTKINFGFGYTTGNNLNTFLMSKDAGSIGDFFGFSGNERNIPNALGSKPQAKTLSKEESLNQFGSGFDVEETKSPLNTNFGVLNAEKFIVGENHNTLQYLFSLNYDNKYQVRKGADRLFNTGQGNYDNNLQNNQYRFITNTSALAAINYKSDKWNLTSNTFYLKTTENMIQDQLGSLNGQTNSNTFIRLNQLLETSFLNSQLLASYKLTKDERQNIKAGISYTKTTFGLPDRKSFVGSKMDDDTTVINYTGNNLYRQYFDIDGEYHMSGLLEYTWKFGKEDVSKSHKLTIGYNGYVNKMESNVRFVNSTSTSSSLSVIIPTNSPDAILASEIQNGNFTYTEGTNSIYNAKLEESINAGYLDLALKFGDSYELNVGARVEQSNRLTKYRNPGSFDDPFISNKLDKLDILPSLNMKYIVNERSNLRLAASKSITKPVIMEAYPLEFVNLDGTIENGNGNVINSSNYNFDLKYEFFPTAKELIAITAFSKFLENPIERIFRQSAGSGGQVMSYDNSKKALLFGAELEFLAQLERISSSLSNFSLGFNTSLMYTKVTIDPIKNAAETNPDRQLQGASPWLINADLKYEFDFSKKWKNTMTLVYNVYGKRIFAVGTNGLDHYYEMPFNKLDFVWNNKISENWDVKFSVDNILNPVYGIQLGSESTLPIYEKDLNVKDYKKGVGFSVNMAYTF